MAPLLKGRYEIDGTHICLDSLVIFFDFSFSSKSSSFLIVSCRSPSFVMCSLRFLTSSSCSRASFPDPLPTPFSLASSYTFISKLRTISSYVNLFPPGPGPKSGSGRGASGEGFVLSCSTMLENCAGPSVALCTSSVIVRKRGIRMSLVCILKFRAAHFSRMSRRFQLDHDDKPSSQSFSLNRERRYHAHFTSDLWSTFGWPSISESSKSWNAEYKRHAWARHRIRRKRADLERIPFRIVERHVGYAKELDKQRYWVVGRGLCERTW